LQTSKTEQYVRELAYHDVLTGLPNRAFFNQQLRHKINRADLNGKKLALLFLDLDRFKLINDSLGHDAGDLVLKAAADRILRSVRKNDMVSRLGGDEFTVVFEDIESADFAAEISKKICDSLRAPFVFMHQRMFVTASIGIAVFPEHGKDSNSLIKHADTAMFKAKEAGLDYCYYEEGMEDEVTQKIQTEQDLRSSLDHGGIIFHYQPQVELATNEVVGFESLARWMHPTRGIVSAFNFIEIAEETGLIGQMSDLAFRNACDQLEAWHTKGFDVRLAVNVSTTDFRDGHFRNKVLTLFDEDQYHFPPSMLEVEITESTLMEQPEAAQEELSVLRAKGVSIAIDDFGSGFSSLNYLKRFTVDLLKIDREFVIDCVTDKNDQAIITGIVTLAKSLGLKVIAEGVETAEQAAFLTNIGCDYAQGYFFGKPAPAEEINRGIESGLYRVKLS
ncbi:MAG: diguanylate phosphodiesterase, partial [Porticoccaceae bacterium]|nr:diguanylate phosphodiesterase [Porticoccaceae bacterium]